MDLKDPWAHEERRVMKDLVETRPPTGPKGATGPQVQQAHPETRAMQVLVDGPPGPKGAPGSMGRNWKQCVF